MSRQILTGYRMMWVLIMFDLPVGTPKERKAAAGFRNFLLDEGCEMCQYSVYLRFLGGKDQADALIRRISTAVPEEGSIHVLCFTDKQYERMVSFRGQTRDSPRKNPEQFVLF